MTDDPQHPTPSPADHRAVVAVVTGGGSGLGRRFAQALSAAGIDVVVAGRTEARLLETQQAAPGPGLLSVRRTDVRDGGSVRDLFGWVEQEYGRVDVLVNNAGMSSPPAPVEDVAEEDWRTIVDTNLTGAFLCAQAAYALMKRQRPQGGRIINNGSISAHVPRPYAIGYTATKHAITGLTRALALEGREHNIACGQIDIGNAATEMTERMAAGVPQADGTVAAEPTFDAGVVADAVVQLARMPLDVTVPFMTVMATGMPYIGRG
jgi:NAD(P)-dependent dehydrogenase (short-subunit alcohol dehydrogenase family)